MRLSLTEQQGFTLVEGIVAGMIAVVVGAVMYTLLVFSGNQVNGSTLNTKINMQYETAIAQIGQVARNAKAVLTNTESFPPWGNGMATTTQCILCYDENGVVKGGYQVSGTSLQEYDTTNHNFKNFKLGTSDSSIKVLSTSIFSLNQPRNQVTVNLTVFANYKGQKDTIPSKHEVFICRNGNPL